MKLNLRLSDLDGNEHDLVYTLEQNVIANKWYKKISHLYRVPLCEHYTYKIKQEKSIKDLSDSVTQDLSQLKQLIDLDFPIKEIYNQDDCNILHAVTISQQYGYNAEVREIFHRMHRTIHLIEFALQQVTVNELYAGWGEKEGPLEEKFDIDPCQLYEVRQPGTLYMKWSEFGKTPWQYWKDQDSDDIDHFLDTCKPHMTFRAQFSLRLSEHELDEFEPEFLDWFESRRDAWNSRYGKSEWTTLHVRGGVPLARPDKDFDWKTANTILSISPYRA
jgi:hypothetical protein